MRAGTRCRLRIRGTNRSSELSAVFQSTGRWLILGVESLEEEKAASPEPTRGAQVKLHLDARVQVLVKPLPVMRNRREPPASAVEREAGRAVPVSLDELLWDAPRLGGDGIEEQRLLFAVKKSALEDLFQEGRRAQAGRLDLVPTALFNLARGLESTGAEASLLLHSENAVFTACAVGAPGLLRCTRMPEETAAAEERMAQEIMRTGSWFMQREDRWRPGSILVTGQDWGMTELKLPFVGSIPVVDFSTVMDAGPCLVDGLELVDERDRALVVGSLLGETAGAYMRVELQSTGARAAARLRTAWAWSVTAAFAFLAAGFLLWWPAGERVKRLRQELERTREELAPVREHAATLERSAREAGRLRERVEQLKSIVAAETFWEAFLSDLQRRLSVVENAWIDRLDLMPEIAAGAESGPGTKEVESSGRRIRIAGRILDPEAPMESVSAASRQRAGRIVEELEGSRFVQGISDRRFLPLDHGILEFRVILELQPEVL